MAQAGTCSAVFIEALRWMFPRSKCAAFSFYNFLIVFPLFLLDPHSLLLLLSVITFLQISCAQISISALLQVSCVSRICVCLIMLAAKATDSEPMEGKLYCFKCSARVGSFTWVGVRCSCGSWVSPAFQLHYKSVEIHVA